MEEPKRVVQRGYDQIAERHAQWAIHTRAKERARYTARLLAALPPGASLLELGCGVGGPTTQALAAQFRLTGVDISACSLELARRNVPQARFLQGDMAEIDLPPASFDAVAAFYSIIHVPRDEQPGLLGRVAEWLRPDGLFLAAFGTADEAVGFEPDWLGVPMYWSTYDSETTQRLVTSAGLSITSATLETADEDGVPVSFLWVEARRSALLTCGSDGSPENV